MSMIDEIVHHRYEHPNDTLQKIADNFGVSRQYIHRVLRTTNTPTLRAKRQRINYCKVCNQQIYNSLAKVHTGRCYGEYYWTNVQCFNCKAEWYMSKSQLKQKDDRGDKNTFCSRKCYVDNRFYNLDHLSNYRDTATLSFTNK